MLDSNFRIAAKYSALTNTFLSDQAIAPSPINYSVIYLYITKKNKQLNKVIDQHIKNNDALTEDVMTSLFTQFVSLSHQIENTVLKPFEETLTDTFEKITAQVNNSSQTNTNLKKLDDVLSSIEHNDAIKNVVSYLISTIDKTKAQHQALSSELSETQTKISKLKVKLESSRQEALVDSLTGLLNRRGCDEKLKDLNSEKTHSSLAIDIDHFKKINDTFGHFVGDKVIQRIAKTIKENIAEQDLAVRFGGEEFVVVAVDKTISEAEKIAENIRLSIAKMKLVQKESNTYLPPISVSIGIAENKQGLDWNSLFEQADNALYQAKNTGRNRCVCI